MDKQYCLYEYDGPVISFGSVIQNHWNAETMAVSKQQALRNLAYRYKKNNNFTSNRKIELSADKITVIREV